MCLEVHLNMSRGAHTCLEVYIHVHTLYGYVVTCPMVSIYIIMFRGVQTCLISGVHLNMCLKVSRCL